MNKYGCLLLLPLILSGCRSNDYTPREEENARKVMVGRPFYESGKGTPAEFATNMRGQMNHEGAVVRGEREGDYAHAVKRLSSVYDDAQLGFQWKLPFPETAVPRLAAPPAVDGSFSAGEWQGARVWQGEYVVSRKNPVPGSAAVWRAGWHGDRLYVAARFPDRDIQSYENDVKANRWIHRGDSLELFLQPDSAEGIYFEFIVNPRGSLWALKHVNNIWGGHVTMGTDLDLGVRTAARSDKEGFTVEMSIPLPRLHGAWCRHSPRSGDSFRFMLVRTNRDGETYTKSSPVPFLYDGHNIYGYFRAKLTD